MESLKEKKPTFEDLNNYTTNWLQEIYDQELTFNNEVLGLNETLPNLLGIREKTQLLHNRLRVLTKFQELIEMSLACVENDEKECEDKISKYENDHLVDLYTAPIDQRRSEIYDKVETIYCHLKNSFESIETLERESSNTNHKPDDLYSTGVIMNNNLSLLETLSMHIQRLRNLLNLNDCFLENEIWKRSNL